MLTKIDGIATDREFSMKMGKTCRDIQTAIRLIHKEVLIKYGTNLMKEKSKTKRDF
jgi:hypothetical protein